MNNLLLVDDDEAVLETLEILLEKRLLNLNILKAGNGRAAVNILNSTPVDLIITDLQMPVMNGFELAEFRQRHYPHVPLIVMSGGLFPEMKNQLNDLDVHRFIEKPFDMPRVVKVISNEMVQLPVLF
jgi:YesN/AraC family two-component response regulator